MVNSASWREFSARLVVLQLNAKIMKVAHSMHIVFCISALDSSCIVQRCRQLGRPCSVASHCTVMYKLNVGTLRPQSLKNIVLLCIIA